MWRWIAVGVGSLAGLALVLWLTLLVGLRARLRPVVNAVRRMNRAFTNPRVLKRAGRPGAPAVIHHQGRKTGTPYLTPVGLAETVDGFVIGLPYGTVPDWLKNVMTEGSAVIDHNGRTYQMVAPEVVSMGEAAQYFSSGEQRTFRLYGVDQAVRLRFAAAEASLPGS